MRDPAYAAFSALDPFFEIVRQGLAGLVDRDHYFDTIGPDAVFEFRYRFPGYPTKVVGREALMALYAGYGAGMALHGADALVARAASHAAEEGRVRSAVLLLPGNHQVRRRGRRGLQERHPPLRETRASRR